MDKSNLCVLKVRVKCGMKDHEDDHYGCYNTECKILFRDHEELAQYQDNHDELKDIIVKNGLIDPDFVRDIQPVRVLDLDVEKWRERMNQHRPNGLTWDTASVHDKMKYISKFLNQHPYRTQLDDAVYPCL